MTSGLRFDMIEDNLMMTIWENMTDVLGYPMENIQVRHGSITIYGSDISEPLIRNATGMNAEDLMREYLWEPIGMDAV